MKKLMLVVAGALVLPSTFLFADELGARIDARVSAMKEARSTARNMARNEARKAQTRLVVIPRPTVNTAVSQPIIRKIEFKPEVVALKETTKQSHKEVIATQMELKKATTPMQKLALENKLKTQITKLKADNAAFKKTVREEARLEVRKAAKTRTTH